MADSVVLVEPPVVLVQYCAPIANVVLNRPERRNALVGPLATAFADAIEAINEDDSLSVVVISGAGGAFCSGLDLKEFNAEPRPEWIAAFPGEWQRAHRALFDCNKIVIVALERYAINGGASLAVAADFLVAGETAFVQVGEIQQGMAAPMNMAWLTLRHSEATAARIALVGDRIAGRELAEIGLAHKVVPDAEVLAETNKLAATFAAHDLSGVHRIKASLRRSGTDLDAQAWMDRVLKSDPLAGQPQRPKAAI